MKTIVADTYSFFINKDASFPKKFRNYKIIWNLREVLFVIWEGKITELALPKSGLPGYDFEKFIDDMFRIGQIKKKPKILFYELNTAKKS